MASYPIGPERKTFPGKTDSEIASALAAEFRYLVVVRYKSSPSSDYDHFGCCKHDYEVAGYFSSSSCHDTEIVYDGRKAPAPSAPPPSEDVPDLLLIVHDNPVVSKQALVQSLVKHLHITVGQGTAWAVHHSPNAQALERALPYAVALAGRYLKERSLELDVSRTVYEHFKSASPLEEIQGYVFRMWGMR